MDEKEAIFFLDFNNKLTNDTFEKDAFIRIANLHKKNPLVQINDTVFEGTYDFAMGTNLFFEAIQETSHSDPFVKRGPMQFEHIFHSIKTINLKQMKVPPHKIELPQETRKIEFNLDWDYPTLLEKLSKGSLKLQDILKKEYQNEVQYEEQPNVVDNENMDVDEQVATLEPTDENNANQEDISENIVDYPIKHNDEVILDDIIPVEDMIPVDDVIPVDDIILKDYHKLRKLAFRPVKKPALLDDVQECDLTYKEAHEYHNLERQILQPCDFFGHEIVKDINEETLSNCVDIDRCVLYGLLEKSSVHPRILTDEEKRKVLTLDNFDNLSLAGRYYVLKTHVNNLENYLETKKPTELNTRDRYGRTPLITLEIFKKLTDAVRRRIEEVKFSLGEIIESDINTETGRSNEGS